MKMSFDTTTTVIQVPAGINFDPATLGVLCRRFRKARLSALQADPAAFSSTYEQESQFDDTAWAQRLQSPMAKTFVALAIISGRPFKELRRDQENSTEGKDDGGYVDNAVEHLCGSDWLGMIVLLGPVALAADGSESTAPWKGFLEMGSSPREDASSFLNREAAYFAVSMFVLPEARRQGIGRKLIAKSCETTRSETAALGASAVSVSLIAEADNTPALQLYRSCGFELLPRHPELETLGQNQQRVVAMAKIMELESLAEVEPA